MYNITHTYVIQYQFLCCSATRETRLASYTINAFGCYIISYQFAVSKNIIVDEKYARIDY